MYWKYLYIFSINWFIHINFSRADFYSYDKNVIELNHTTFKDFIFNKTYASLVEFYNSFCGHCRRYIKTWRSLASDIKSWNDIIKVSGIDCSESENYELCRQYKILSFPSIRYFSPYLVDDPNEKHIGQPSEHEEKDVMKVIIVDFLQNETDTPRHWPDLTSLPDDAKPKDIFGEASNNLKYLIFVYPGMINTHIGHELALDYHIEKEILIKQLNSKETNHNMTIDAIARDLKVETLPTEVHNDHMDVRKILEKYLTDRGIVLQSNHSTDTDTGSGSECTLSDEEYTIINKVKNMTNVVFQAE